jgi:hypothetical protein
MVIDKGSLIASSLQQPDPFKAQLCKAPKELQIKLPKILVFESIRYLCSPICILSIFPVTDLSCTLFPLKIHVELVTYYAISLLFIDKGLMNTDSWA